MVIAGPTAAGKTELAANIARRYATHVVSADSRQIYRELDIGVARPSPETLSMVPHHFIASHSVQQLIGAGHFEREAIALINSLHKEHDVVVMAGGSGLYLDAVMHGVDDLEEVPPTVREQIITMYAEKGISWLQEEVRRNDPDYFSRADVQNRQRLMRALELLRHTGKRMDELRKGNRATRPFKIIKLLVGPEREELYRRIDARVEGMMARGLVDEAKRLYPLRGLNALKTVGYTELFDHFEGRHTLDEAVRLIQQHTRNYAKRQMTWFRRSGDYTQFKSDGAAAILKYLDETVR